MIAIDVLIEPDSALLQRARAANAVLRADHPPGFAFDDTHLPHVTLVQRYVRRDDLPAVCEAVRDIAMQHDVRAMHLQATGLHMRATDTVGSASWTLANTPALQALADACLDAAAPFAISGGGQAAFVPNEDGTPIRDSTIDYVERFAPDHSGANYAPHITLGRARAAFLRELQRAPFEAFVVSPAAIAVYQLGNHGTARRRLWPWPAG
ncbi:2'-5' RNA ligase family protein [Lysobacter sp. LF1]|uniref:2'-5' RNA ligase family protein n=1 Tax=Lysobacter stagni TaxID=3045172 RepID=A0ABT6XKF8_9GAMM|nr:2'-5' RNA ligase family protein [Lysobacter sp. LF1]MDI9240655.1 2'-5' RNA ligase family protein [Lysobacter sp. LF1]